MKKRFKEVYTSLTLASKIRISYMLIMVPMLTFLLICLLNIWAINARYAKLIEACGTASEFNLDFKKDFDYETYLLIVENKSVEESGLNNLLNEANRIVNNLRALDNHSENNARLKSVSKYISNLETYKSRIEENLETGNMYEENIEIWENDVQIVTELVKESMMEYIYYEIQDMELSRVYYQTFYMRLIIVMMVAFIAITVGVVVLSYYIPLSISKPVTELTEVANQVANGDLKVRAKPETYQGGEAVVLGESLNSMIDKVNSLLNQVTEEQISLRNAELALLQAQINPHFLYNTLDAIVWLAEAGQDKQVVAMVESLSEFFRTSLSQGKEVIFVSEDISHVTSYLKIQQMRYQDILQYDIDVAKDVLRASIPKITIQPIVENALYHGIKNKRGGGRIHIRAFSEDEKCIILVEDNGIGMEKERLEAVRAAMRKNTPGETDIYGLFNVNERIRLKFGEAYGLSIDSTYGEGTTVKITLPMP